MHLYHESMDKKEKQVSYRAVNTYLTLNKPEGPGQNIWVVFHGIGYLGRFFANHFKLLDPDKNYIIVPQAPSKYYLNNQYKHVGASWLTRENTETETENILNYMDAVIKAEALPPGSRLIIFGFSQGVSVAMRWVARRKIPCSRLLLYAGGIPKELNAGDFTFLGKEAKVRMAYGDQDKYLDAVRLNQELSKARDLFGSRVEFRPFTGGHEIKSELLKELAK